MKQIHVKTLLILLLAGMAIPTLPSDRKTYRLELNLKENQNYKQHTSIVMETSNEAMGKKFIISTETRMDITYMPKIVDKDLITMDFTYDNIRSITNSDMDGFKMEIDSDKPLPESAFAPLDIGRIYKAITGIPISVTITKKGKIQSVSGTNKLSEAILNTIDTCNLPASTKDYIEQLTSQIVKYYSDPSIKRSLEQNLSYLPDYEVAIGDRWNIAMDLHEPYEMAANMEMKLVDVNTNIATIEANGTISTPGEIISERPQGPALRINLTGTQSGLIKMDLGTGLPVDAEFFVESEGESESIRTYEKDGEQKTESEMTPISIKLTIHITSEP